MSGRHGIKGKPNKVLVAIISGIAITAAGVVIAFAADAFWGIMTSLVGVALTGAASRIRFELRERAADNAHGPGSLIQQRMRLKRPRKTGLLFIAASVIFPVFELILVSINPSRPFRFTVIFPVVMFVAIGMTQLVMAANERRRLENEFGRGAGRQQAAER